MRPTISTAIALAFFGILACLGIKPASAAQMQMLPPTFSTIGTPCTGNNQILIYSGATGVDGSGNAVSAINCLDDALTILPVYQGTSLQYYDLWLGSQNAAGKTFTTGASELGPRLHLSGATGYNSDDIYFQRMNDATNISELRLSVGDDAGSPFGGNGGGDAFVIGATDYHTMNWVPRFYFTSNGSLGVGSNNPQASLHVVAPSIDNNHTGILIEEASSWLSSPRLGMVDTSLGDVTTAPGWFIDNLQDNFRIFRQININTPGSSALSINNNGFIAIGQPMSGIPIAAGNLDIQQTPEQVQSDTPASLCLNGDCIKHVAKGNNISMGNLVNYHKLCSNNPLGGDTTTPSTYPNCVAACNRYCAGGCNPSINGCVGTMPGLGYAGGTMVEYDAGTNQAECLCY